MSSHVVNKKKIKKSLFNFKNMAMKINDYLKDDEITFSFEGYNSLLLHYFKFIENYIDDISDLLTELNLWFNTLSEFEGFIELKYLECELEFDIIIAKNYNSGSEFYENMRKKKFHFKEFLRQIQSQKKMILNANWHCSKELRTSIKKY